MDMDKAISKKVKEYYVILTVLLVLLQVFTAFFFGSEVNAWTALLLVCIAIYSFVFNYHNFKSIRKVAYLEYKIHAVTYLLINLSFWLHATYLYLVDFSFSSAWKGALFAMPLFWGIGLLFHTFGTLISKGYENVEI